MRPRLLAPVLILLLCSAAGAQAQAQAEAKSGYFTTSDGVRLHYLEAGKGPPIVFIPGWTVPAWIWQPQLEHFAKTHRVIALDMRSQGESARPADGHYLERRAADIHDLIEYLKLEDVTLVGWSLAVAEVLTYARDFGTGKLRALVLVDGTLPDPERDNSASSRGMMNWLMQMQKDREKFTDGFVRSFYKRQQPPEYIERMKAGVLKTPTNSAVVLLANMITLGDWRPWVGKIDRPVLYVSQPQLKASGELLKAVLPPARIEVFEGAGHALFVDQPEKFNRVLEKFANSAAAAEKK